MNKKIAIVNGPNLNLLGKREVQIYGSESFEDYLEKLIAQYPEWDFQYFQSNVEGELIDYLQQTATDVSGIIINPGAYAHTSVALADCIAAIDTTIVEVHISNIYAREEYRHQSLTAAHTDGLISGMGLDGYELALIYLTHLNQLKLG